MSKEMFKDKTVLPENLAAKSAATRMGNIPNLSTDVIEETAPFKSLDYDANFKAQANLQSEHLEMASRVTGMEPIMQMRSELAPIAAQIQKLTLPDTRVSVDQIKMEVPFELKQYAMELDQAWYNKVVFEMLGAERMAAMHKHCLKSNQAHCPALWLNQALIIETKRQYVYMLSQKIGPETMKALEIDPETAEMCEQFLRPALGGTLAVQIKNIANVNQTSMYVIFHILVDEILKRCGERFTPVTDQSIWDFKPKAGEQG